MRKLMVLFIVTLLAACDFIGGGETVVRGNNNLVTADHVIDRVAAHLAGYDTTPAVTDDELQAMFTTIRQAALEGDLRASLVVLKVASIQRQPEEPDE